MGGLFLIHLILTMVSLLWAAGYWLYYNRSAKRPCARIQPRAGPKATDLENQAVVHSMLAPAGVDKNSFAQPWDAKVEKSSSNLDDLITCYSQLDEICLAQRRRLEDMSQELRSTMEHARDSASLDGTHAAKRAMMIRSSYVGERQQTPLTLESTPVFVIAVRHYPIVNLAVWGKAVI